MKQFVLPPFARFGITLSGRFTVFAVGNLCGVPQFLKVLHHFDCLFADLFAQWTFVFPKQTWLTITQPFPLCSSIFGLVGRASGFGVVRMSLTISIIAYNC